MAKAIIGASARRCRRPRSTASTSTRSGTSSVRGRNRAAVVCSASTIRVRTENSATKRTNLLALGLRRRLRHPLGHDQHLLEAAKVRRRGHVDGEEEAWAFAHHRGHFAHQQAARKNPVQARGNYGIAALHVLRAIDVLHD